MTSTGRQKVSDSTIAGETSLVMNDRMRNKVLETKLAAPGLDRPSMPKLDLSAAWDWRHNIEKLIAEHAGTCLAAAIGAGYVLGWWIKRK